MDHNKEDFSSFVAIIIKVPQTHADVVRDALGKAGAGKMGNYSHCSFSTKGIGRFQPEEGSNPFLGKTHILEEVLEERIETVCDKKILKEVIDAVKKVHPYEEVPIDIYPLYNTKWLN